jgi:hypothetical protein
MRAKVGQEKERSVCRCERGGEAEFPQGKKSAQRSHSKKRRAVFDQAQQGERMATFDKCKNAHRPFEAHAFVFGRDFAGGPPSITRSPPPKRGVKRLAAGTSDFMRHPVDITSTIMHSDPPLEGACAATQGTVSVDAIRSEIECECVLNHLVLGLPGDHFLAGRNSRFSICRYTSNPR